MKRQLSQIRRSYKRYQRKVGTTVTWYEFDTAASHTTDVYDESPAAEWKPGFTVPVMSLIRDEARQTAREEGLYAIGTIHVTISAEQALLAGMADPWDAESHLNDRFGWDGKFWEVRRWQISGRFHRTEVVIGIDATQVAIEEMVNQADFPT